MQVEDLCKSKTDHNVCVYSLPSACNLPPPETYTCLKAPSSLGNIVLDGVKIRGSSAHKQKDENLNF